MVTITRFSFLLFSNFDVPQCEKVENNIHIAMAIKSSSRTVNIN